MPRFKIKPKQNVIVCHVEIAGPKVELSLKMAVDTGTTYTMIPVEAAIAIGRNPLRAKHKIEITAGSSAEYKHVPLITVPKFRAFGIELKNLEVICHNLPHHSPVQGLLGLNFLQKAKIIIDFSKNTIHIPFER